MKAPQAIALGRTPDTAEESEATLPMTCPCDAPSTRRLNHRDLPPPPQRQKSGAPTHPPPLQISGAKSPETLDDNKTANQGSTYGVGPGSSLPRQDAPEQTARGHTGPASRVQSPARTRPRAPALPRRKRTRRDGRTAFQGRAVSHSRPPCLREAHPLGRAGLTLTSGGTPGQALRRGPEALPNFCRTSWVGPAPGCPAPLGLRANLPARKSRALIEALEAPSHRRPVPVARQARWDAARDALDAQPPGRSQLLLYRRI